MPFVAKCTNCNNKHGLPLNEGCLALLVITEGQLDDGPDESDLLQDEHNGEDDNLLQAMGGVPQCTATPDDLVATQVAHIVESLVSLGAMHQSTREVAELVASRTQAFRSRNNVSSQASYIPAPPASLASAMAVSADTGFIPKVPSLRADAHLAAQAEQQVSDVARNVAGNAPLINTIKH
jgi:hypothetical protein